MSAIARQRPPKIAALVSLIAVTAIGSSGFAQTAPAPAAAKKKSETAAAAKTPPKFKDFNEVTKDAERISGLFTLYRTDEHLYAEIRSNQFNQPFLAPMAIARGLASAGNTLNFGDEWVLLFRRVGDHVLLIRQNIHYEAPKGTPLEKAVKQNYTDSVLLSLPIISVKRGGGAISAPAGSKGGGEPPAGGSSGGESVLIDFNDIFFTDFAELGIGRLDPKRTSWHQVKAFPNNIELEVEATFDSAGRFWMFGFGDSGVVDPRGITLVLHYSLVKLAGGDYKPRYADQRVGYFISATKDFGSKDRDTLFARRLNRWGLEKADAQARLSPPKRQLVWWVEDTVPHEYRPYVEQGILEWNKAFEKIGYRNVLGVRWQNERDEFDPEDINYCTFRWITTPSTFAMSTLRANPLTGEMIDGDVVFDASWIRHWKDEHALLVGIPAAAASASPEVSGPLDLAEIISPIMAARHGFGLAHPLPAIAKGAAADREAAQATRLALFPAAASPLRMQLIHRSAAGPLNACQCALGMQHDYKLAAIAFAAADKGDGAAELPEEFIGQAIKSVVMHEVGHSLGLRHNFKASTMLSLDQINDVAVTSKKGLSGSVMDYNPINIARQGQKQGEYAMTTIGPYDYWAIEYAYKPLEKDEAEELKKIAARSPEPDLTYATDEDLQLSNDPLVHAFDLGSDPLRYGQERMALAAELLKELDGRIVKDGESWARLRTAFGTLLSQYGNAAFLASAHIGGQSFHRDAKGGEKGRDPIIPVAGDRQREALTFLVNEILADKNYRFSPALLRRLTTEHWYHWGSDMRFGSSVDFPIYDRVLSIQRIVLSQCLNAATLRRLQNQPLLAGNDARPLRVDELFRVLTDSIWSELAPQTNGSSGPLTVSLVRRNLQREHLRRLGTMVIGNSPSLYGDMFAYAMFASGGSAYPADARALAGLHLRETQDRIEAALKKDSAKTDDLTRAHLQDCQAVIKRLLEARFDARDP